MRVFAAKRSESTSAVAGAKQSVTCADIKRKAFGAKFHAELATNSNIDAVLQILKRGSVQTSLSYVLCMIRDAAREQAARSER